MTTFYCDIDEAAVATSSIFSDVTTQIDDVIVAVDTFLIELSSTITETAVAVSTAFDELGVEATETATAVSTLLDHLVAVNVLVAEAVAEDGVDGTADDLATSMAAATSALLDSRDAQINELATAADALLTSTTRDQLVIELAEATSELFGYTDAMIDEAVVGASTLFDQRTSSVTITEVAAAVSSLFTSISAEDMITEQALAASSTFFGTDVYDDLIIEMALAYSTIFATPRNGAWVTNTETMAMSRYTSLPVNSVATIGGITFGLRQDGLLSMGAEDDEGTLYYPSIRTGASTLGAAALKQIGDVLISYACAGTMAVRVATYGGKNEGTYTYELPVRRAAAPRANRLTVGKGLRGRYFSFEFTTLDGSSFDVDSVAADVAVNTRRV